MAKLAALTLIRFGACRLQVRYFLEQFGEEVEVTEELCAQYFDEFDWDWASEFLLSGQADRTRSKWLDRLVERSVQFRVKYSNFYARPGVATDWDRLNALEVKIEHWESIMAARFWARLYIRDPRTSFRRRRYGEPVISEAEAGRILKMYKLMSPTLKASLNT